MLYSQVFVDSQKCKRRNDTELLWWLSMKRKCMQPGLRFSDMLGPWNKSAQMCIQLKVPTTDREPLWFGIVEKCMGKFIDTKSLKGKSTLGHKNGLSAWVIKCTEKQVHKLESSHIGRANCCRTIWLYCWVEGSSHLSCCLVQVLLASAFKLAGFWFWGSEYANVQM